MDTRIETATLALGWFWFPESAFGSANGVIRTRVGYTGGTKENPTYHDLGDHTETIEFDYDPTLTNYDNILNIFWEQHYPYSKSSRQYMSAIFYHNQDQKQKALKSKEEKEKSSNRKIYTVIAPSETFYLAEDYHQKFELQKHSDIVKAFKFKSTSDMINSIAASRVNGYLGGNGTLENLNSEIPTFNLSKEVELKLKSRLDKGSSGSCGVRW